jgi:hypothetical protein
VAENRSGRFQKAPVPLQLGRERTLSGLYKNHFPLLIPIKQDMNFRKRLLAYNTAKSGILQAKIHISNIFPTHFVLF